MNQPEDEKPPDHGGPIVLGPDDLPPGLADQIAAAFEHVRPMASVIDHGFLLERARASGWDAKQLRKYYPDYPKWARQDLLDGKLTLDSHGRLHVLH